LRAAAGRSRAATRPERVAAITKFDTLEDSMTLKSTATAALALAAIALGARTAAAADTVKIAFIDPLSGTFANVGETGLRHIQLAVEQVNARGGVKFEVVPLDSKAKPQDALLAFKQAVDQGIQYVTQGNSSAVALALSDAVSKHNARSPEQPVLYLNYGAVAPELTNEKCNFWHFRFDADAEMKMNAITNTIAGMKDIKSIYLINQDYAFGQAVSRAAKEQLAKKRPDIKIVGDDLHPLGQVKDFAPYIAKIKSSGASAVITGNWGTDISLLTKAAHDADLKIPYFTYYAGGLGAAPAIGEAGVGRLKQVTGWIANIPSDKVVKNVMTYKERFKDAPDDLYWSSIREEIEMLAKAMGQAKSTDPKKVAFALEGMKWENDVGEVVMRADNHQLIQPLFISTYSKADGKDVKYDVEKTGFGFKLDNRVEGKDTVLPTTCKMERPAN
jgi:branched-chain amino acid transport system substrate-binding protein